MCCQKILNRSAAVIAACLMSATSAWAQPVCVTCPADAQATAVAAGLTVVRASDGSVVQPGQTVSACETLNVLGTIAYSPQVLIFQNNQPVIVTGSGFYGGTASISVNNANPLSPFNVTPADLANFKVGPAPCADATLKGMNNLAYTITAADVAAGSVTFSLTYSNGHSLLGNCSLLVGGFSQFQVFIEPCEAQDACHTASCVNGVCVQTPINCDDGDACTTDTCDPATGCVHTPVNCNDNDACTTDTCNPATGCVHTPVDCNDNDDCTIDSCDPTLGCQYAPNPACACVTRTQGYWFNHVTGAAGCATLQAAINAAGGSFNLGFTTVNLDQALGYFWTKGKNANALCFARQKAATQLIAAIANTVLLNSADHCATGRDLVAEAQAVLAGCDPAAINAIASELDAFNNSGDALSFPAGLNPCSAGKDQKAYIGAHAVPPDAACNACP